MAQFIGFGNGQDGSKTVTATEDVNGTPRSCSGSQGDSYVTVAAGDEAEFSAGDMVLIHHSRGTTSNTGGWEINRVDYVTSGEVNLDIPLNNTYTDSGADQSQILVIPQYTDLAVQSGGKIQADAWNGNVGGIVAVACSGKVDIQSGGSIDMDGRGYVGPGNPGSGQPGVQGEGTGGAGSASTSANGNGGGGGGGGTGNAPGGGGGGSNGTLGTSGTAGSGGSSGGTRGATAGSADLTTMVFGGAGGSGGNRTGFAGDNNTNPGNNGGGIVVIFAGEFKCVGTITVDGSGPSSKASNDSGSGGSGAGGSVLIKTKTATLGNNLIAGLGAAAPTADGDAGDGGAGGNGRNEAEGCSITGITNPANNASAGGYAWCGSIAAIVF